MNKQGPQPWNSQLLVDCDGVLAKPTIRTDLIGADYGHPDFLALDEPGFASGMSPTDGSHEFVFQVADMGLDMTVLTSSWDSSKTWGFDRKAWLLEKFGIHNSHVIFAKQKWLVGGLTLVEDKAENANWWSHQHNKPSILIDQPWNLGQVTSNMVIRVASLKEATAAIRTLHASNNCSR